MTTTRDDQNGTEPHERPTGQIRADRACIACGFNLHGQPVHKEPHYGLAIARCPECGTAAALQQYPTATHLVSRYRGLLGAFWIGSLLIIALLNVMHVMFMIESVAQAAGSLMTERIVFDYEAWMEQGQGSGQAAQISFNLFWVDPAWVRDHLETTVRQAGGLWENFSVRAVYALVGVFIAAVPWGVWWSIALLGSSRLKVMIASVGIVLVGVLLDLAPAMNSGSMMNVMPTQIAGDLYRLLVLPMVVPVAILGMALGVRIGRPCARWIIVAALPPRARAPFGVFWTRDGLDLPSARGA